MAYFPTSSNRSISSSQNITVQFAGQPWQITLKSHCSDEVVAALSVERGLGVFSDHNPTLERERLRQVAERPDGNVCLAYTDEGFIVGYVACYLPEPDNRWGQSHLPELYELGAVEVSRNWRGLKLGKQLVAFAATDPAWSELIVISQEFSWHWDLRNSGLEVSVYRERLREVMAAGGFELFETTEPNIAFFPHNFFMARIGSQVSPESRQRFFDLLVADPQTDDFFDNHGF